MSKQLFNNPNGHRGAAEVKIPMHELYNILLKRIERMDGNFDPDAICQQICVDIEKQQGTFPNFVEKISTIDLSALLVKLKAITGDIPTYEKPVAIWDTESCVQYHVADQHVKEAWNSYANKSALEDAEAYMRGDLGVKNPMTLHQWAPSLTFEKWAEKNGHTVLPFDKAASLFLEKYEGK